MDYGSNWLLHLLQAEMQRGRPLLSEPRKYFFPANDKT